MALEVIQIPAGDAANFTYLVCDRQSGEAVAIDPSFTPDALLSVAEQEGLQIILLANTHGHRDHIFGNERIIEATGARLAAHPADLPQADIQLADGDRITVGENSLEVLHTPGHSPGSVTFATGDAVITGDTLFVSRCGRADLPGSNVEDLYRSLQRLKALPPETTVFPGHDYGPQPTSTIGNELETNEFIRCNDLESFIKLRMG